MKSVTAFQRKKMSQIAEETAKDDTLNELIVYIQYGWLNHSDDLSPEAQ